MRRIVVLGLGNLLMGDDALGVHAVRRLAERVDHPEVACLDGGTLGLALLPLMEDASHLLILDAIGTDDRPGTVVEVPGDVLHAFPAMKFSVHDVALPDLLNLLLLRRDEDSPVVRIVGAVPQLLEASTDMSEAVARSVTPVVDRAEAIVRDWLQA